MKINVFMVLAAGAVVASAFSAFGVTVATTADNNSYDLAAPATYSGGVLPAASDTVRLASGQATYTCSEDVTFGMIYFSGNGQTIDLSATPGRTITLGNSNDGIYPWGNNRSLALVGGTYFFSNRGKLVVTDNPNASVSLSGGAVVTNVGTVKVRGSATDTAGATLSLAGSGTLLDTFGVEDNYSGPVSYSYTGDPMETGVGIDVSGGAIIRAHASGDYGGCFNPSGVTIVRKAGSAIEVTKGYAYIGSRQPGTIVHITDGGNFTTASDLFVSDNVTRGDNHLRVDNGGTANLKSVNISGRNDKPNGTNTWLEVVSGGSVTVGNDVSLCGTNQHVVVSNGTLSVAGNLKIGNFTSDRGHEVRISGASSSLVNNKGYFFYSGSGHRFTLDDGAVLSRGDIYFTNGATDAADGRHGHKLEVLGGARLSLTGSLHFRDYNGGRIVSNGNTLRVASGGEVSSDKSITLRCADNTVSISNGTVVCTESFSAGGNETSNNGTVYPSSGGRVILEGETPRLACSGTGTFNDGVTILFHPSASGFTTTAPVLTFANIVSDGTAVLSFEGIRQLQKTLRETKTYTLAEATGAKGSVGFTDAQIAAANETLPEKCHIGKSPDGKRLLLKVSVELPTRFIVK